MWKKIRCCYWKKRDAGKGKQFILSIGAAVILVVVLFFGLALLILKTSQSPEVSPDEKNSVSGSAVSGDAWDPDFLEKEEASGNEAEPTQEENIDVSGLDPFSGFMSDDAYEKLQDEVLSICRKKHYFSAKKLPYEHGGETQFDVESFIQMSDGTIYSCRYNLKKNQYSLASSDFTEKELKKEQEKKDEQETKELEQEQNNIKKKFDKEKKNNKQNKKKGKKKK